MRLFVFLVFLSFFGAARGYLQQDFREFIHSILADPDKLAKYAVEDGGLAFHVPMRNKVVDVKVQFIDRAVTSTSWEPEVSETTTWQGEERTTGPDTTEPATAESSTEDLTTDGSAAQAFEAPAGTFSEAVTQKLREVLKHPMLAGALVVVIPLTVLLPLLLLVLRHRRMSRLRKDATQAAPQHAGDLV
jgi:hypothetical protein